MSKRGLEHLEGDVALQPLVAGAVDFPHPPRAYLFQNSVVTQYFTNHAKLKRRRDGMLGRGRHDVNWVSGGTAKEERNPYTQSLLIQLIVSHDALFPEKRL